MNGRAVRTSDTRMDSAFLGVVAGGVAGEILTFGIARYAYTPILPSMQAALHLSASFLGLLGSLNLLGYLFGALVAAAWLNSPAGSLRLWIIRIAIAVVVVATLGMGFASTAIAWMALRFIGGFASALVMVFLSALILDWAVLRKTWLVVGVVYSGVGLGIVLSGLLTPFFLGFGGWQGAWRAFGLLVMLFALPAWLFLREPPAAPVTSTKQESPTSQTTGFLAWAISAYALEGLAYLVTGTFLVAMLEASPRLHAVGTMTWTIVGVAAAPSTWIWTRVGDRIGVTRSLIIAYALQAVGVILPILFASAAMAFVGAALFGGTFMGIVALSVSIARVEAGMHADRTIAWMTTLYSIGQVIGPMAAGALIDATGGYAAPLTGSFCILLVACGLLLAGQRAVRRSCPLRAPR